jgi:hypothetical protein
MKIRAFFYCILGLSTLASGALAAEEGTSGYAVLAPARALEINAGGGLSKGFGAVSDGGADLGDVASLGNLLQVAIGYRASPRWLVGGYAEGVVYRPGEGSFGDRRSFAFATGVQTQWHALPFARFDPWLGAGAGFRAYWLVDDEDGTTALQGVDLARLQLGVDCHLSSSFLLSPTLGLAVSEFLSSRGPQASSFDAASDFHPAMFLSFGTFGRFDIGGVRVGSRRAVAAAR